jgi:DNA repair protein RecO (recombination protein O)
LTKSLYKTKGVVLRITKYGETSLISLIYTEQFGIQSYLIQGVRTQGPKKKYQPNYFQPGAILDLIIYHQEQKSLQRIQECKWSFLYDSLLANVVKNSIMLYIIELITKTIKQPETNHNLFAFIEDALIWLDKCPTEKTASLPIYFALHLSGFLGFQLNNDHKEKNNILDLLNGKFIAEMPEHTQIHQGTMIEQIKELMKVMHPNELTEIPLNRNTRKEILDLLEKYYSIHLPEFGKMKTLPILKQLMD